MQKSDPAPEFRENFIFLLTIHLKSGIMGAEFASYIGGTISG